MIICQLSFWAKIFLGKINFLPIKIVAGRWDTKTKTRPPCPFILYTLWAFSARGWGMRVCQPISLSLWSSFLLLLLRFCRVNPPQAAVLQDKPSAVWAPLCRPVFPHGMFTFSDVGSSIGCREIPVPPRPTQLATSKPAPAPGAPPPTPFAQTLGFAELLLTHVLTSSVLTACEISYFFLNVFSQKFHQLNWQDQLCLVEGSMLDLAGSSHVTWGSPQFYRSPAACPSLPEPSHLHPVQTVY